MKIRRFPDRLINSNKLFSALPNYFLILLNRRGLIHGRKYAEKGSGGGMHGKSSLFYLAAPAKTGINEAG
jgi:hypothetical protein